MKTITKTVDELINTEESPLDLSIIPNYMGINLYSVESLTWTRQDDGQLVNLTINFKPDTEGKSSLQNKQRRVNREIWGARHWDVLEFAGWDKTTDYKMIGKKMTAAFKPEVLKEAKSFYSELLKELEVVLDDYAEAQTGKRHGYYGLGDDGFWDLRAHIIGLGEQVFLKVLKDPSIAKRMADERDFKENFGYIFQYTGDE